MDIQNTGFHNPGNNFFTKATLAKKFTGASGRLRAPPGGTPTCSPGKAPGRLRAPPGASGRLRAPPGASGRWWLVMLGKGKANYTGIVFHLPILPEKKCFHFFPD